MNETAGIAGAGEPAAGADVPLTKGALALEREPLVSSFIDSAGYDPDRKWLALAMKSGYLYVYAGVPFTIWQRFSKSPSKGRFYNKEIRHHYGLAESGLLKSEPRLRSTAIRAIDYLEEEQLLLVEFGSGHVYRYRDVPAAAYAALKQAESAAVYFNAFVRDLYEVVDDDALDL